MAEAMDDEPTRKIVGKVAGRSGQWSQWGGGMVSGPSGPYKALPGPYKDLKEP